MTHGFIIAAEDGIQIGGWYSDFAEARAALSAFVDCGCSGLRIESCDAGERSDGGYSTKEPQEMTSRWSRKMGRSA